MLQKGTGGGVEPRPAAPPGGRAQQAERGLGRPGARVTPAGGDPDVLPGRRTSAEQLAINPFCEHPPWRTEAARARGGGFEGAHPCHNPSTASPLINPLGSPDWLVVGVTSRWVGSGCPRAKDPRRPEEAEATDRAQEEGV